MSINIKNWAFISLLALLTACGGSDPTTTTPVTTPPVTTPDDTTVPEVDLGDPDANVGIGYGIGVEFKNGVAFPALTSLSSGGSTSVTINLVDIDNANAVYLGQRTIKFNSYCAQLGLAEFTPSSIQASGLGISNYQDKGCGKQDNVFVSMVEEVTSDDGDVSFKVLATATTIIDVKLPVVGSIKFKSADPAAIALKGVGSDFLPEISTLQFEVMDRSGNPMFAKEVRFKLDHIIGDVSLSRDSAVTNLEGIATIQLLSGRVNGSVRVSATVDVEDEDGNYVTDISTQSNPVGMTTGLPDQNSFSIGANILNPHAWDVNGTTVAITVRVADHYQNPVPDGTIVVFNAEGGSVIGNCSTFNGACSVNWVAQNPKPIDGIVTIVGRTVGVSDYQDLNSNGLFDIGEPFVSQGEVFTDANGNGVFDKDAVYMPDVDFNADTISDVFWDSTVMNFFEEFFDYNNNGVRDTAPAVYQGVSCSDAAIAAGHCATLGEVSDSVQLIMSEGWNPNIEGPFILNQTTDRFETLVTCIDVSGGQRDVMWRVSDSAERRNKLPNGASVEFTSDSWLEFKSGGNSERIANYYAPLRFDKWSLLSNNSGLSNEDKKYKYLNERGHTYMAGIAYDITTTTRIDDIGDVSLKVVFDDKTTESSLAVSAIGTTYASLKNQSGSVVSSAILNATPQEFSLVVTTPCGEGLETGAIISIVFANGVTSAWSSSEQLNQTSADTVTVVVTNDRRAGGNIITFSFAADGSTNTDISAISVTTRSGQVNEEMQSMISVAD